MHPLRTSLAAALALVLSCSSDPPKREYPTCPSVTTAPGALAAKAARFDELAESLHMPAGQDLLHSVRLTADLSAYENVNLSDNSGFWTATYTASQALRYATTKDPRALAQLRRALNGQATLMRITGVSGLFARSYVNLSAVGFPNESQLLSHYPDCDLNARHCKRWTKHDSGEFQNHMFKNDVSKDEYSGHMFAFGVIAEVIEDAEIRATARDLATQVANHMINNKLEFKDIDGVTTTFGYMNPASFNDYPGFNALLTLAWIKVGAALSEDSAIQAFYEQCLLHRDVASCADQNVATASSYIEHLEDMGLDLDCQTNWNNHNMSQLAMYNLIRHEKDESVRLRYQSVLDRRMWNAEASRPMKEQQNTLFTFFYELNRAPTSASPDAELDDAVCVLKKFPEEKYHRAIDHSEYTEVCRDRSDEPLTDVLIPFEERQVDNFIWTKIPYRIEQEAEDRRTIESPEDYLLAYWMGRYFGMIGEEL